MSFTPKPSDMVTESDFDRNSGEKSWSRRGPIAAHPPRSGPGEERFNSSRGPERGPRNDRDDRGSSNRYDRNDRNERSDRPDFRNNDHSRDRFNDRQSGSSGDKPGHPMPGFGGSSGAASAGPGGLFGPPPPNFGMGGMNSFGSGPNGPGPGPGPAGPPPGFGAGPLRGASTAPPVSRFGGLSGASSAAPVGVTSAAPSLVPGPGPVQSQMRFHPSRMSNMPPGATMAPSTTHLSAPPTSTGSVSATPIPNRFGFTSAPSHTYGSVSAAPSLNPPTQAPTNRFGSAHNVGFGSGSGATMTPAPGVGGSRFGSTSVGGPGAMRSGIPAPMGMPGQQNPLPQNMVGMHSRAPMMRNPVGAISASPSINPAMQQKQYQQPKQ